MVNATSTLQMSVNIVQKFSRELKKVSP